MMDSPRLLPSTRITDLFPFPAQGYELHELPPGAEIHFTGLRHADPDIVDRVRAELAPYPWPGGIDVRAVAGGAGLWLFWAKESKHCFIPYPPERLQFENGDTVYDVGIYRSFGRVRLGKIDLPPGLRVEGVSYVRWDGETTRQKAVFARFELHQQWILPTPRP